MENVSPNKTFFEVLSNINSHFWSDLDCGVDGSASKSIPRILAIILLAKFMNPYVSAA
jgi:hypothetical protein